MWTPNLPTVILGTVATSAAVISLFKDFYSGAPYDRETPAHGKVAIITGANSGIGREATWELAKRGAKVFMACRDMQRCEDARRDIVMETGNKYVYCRPCDLSSLQSVRNFVKRFKAEESELHILVNNAGVMGVEKGLTSDGFETHLGVNYLGHFLLTNLLLDTLKASAPSRVVVVAGQAHFQGKIHKDDLNLDKNYDHTTAYNQSKLANVLFATELGKRLLDTKVSVCAVDPGLTDTKLTKNLPMMKSIISYIIYPLFWPFMKNARIGSQTIIHAALDKSTENIKGDYFVDMKKHEPSEASKDFELAQWLWKVSEKWTRLHEKNL